MTKSRKFSSLTVDEKRMLSDTKLTGKILGEYFGVTAHTISIWRRKLDIKVSNGPKKGVRRKRVVNKKCLFCDSVMELSPAAKDKIYCSKKCMNKCPVYRKKLSNVDKSYMQLEEYRNAHRKEETPEYVRYKNLVHRLSEKEYQKHIDIINPNGYKRTLCGVKDGWQLDHIIEVRFGFDNNIDPEVLSSADNLRMIPWKENLKRNRKKTSTL